MRRIRLYSLRTINDKSTLSFDLTGLITSETHYNIQIKLPSGDVYLNHSEYLNKMKVYDDSELFFVVCTKQISTKYAKKVLIKYALEKVDKTLDTLTTRLNKLTGFKERLQGELIAA